MGGSKRVRVPSGLAGSIKGDWLDPLVIVPHYAVKL